MIKLGQNYLMTNDLEMYDEERDKKMLCQSMNIPEELGQIKYILSDKTGTLTENKMVFKLVKSRLYRRHESFRSCAIESEIFEAELLHRQSILHLQPPTNLPFRINGFQHSQSTPSFSTVTLADKDDQVRICERLRQEVVAEISQNRRTSRFYFLLNMTVCNTVMVRSKQKVDNVEMGYVENEVYNVGNSAFFVSADNSITTTSVTTPKTLVF